MNRKAGIAMSLALLAIAFVAGALFGRQVLPISGNAVFEDETEQLRETIDELRGKIAELEGLGEEELAFEEIIVCEESSDCVVVDREHCCGSTKAAINSEYLDYYNSREDLQRFDDEEMCAAIGVCADDSEINSAACFENRCILIIE